MKESNRQYILVTPIKNEEKNLPNLIQSVIKQTVKPVLWVIVDDGSTDNSPEIINEAKEKYGWIQSIRLNEGVRDSWLHLADVLKKGFDFCFEYCKNNGINFDYLGTVDGDIILEDLYYEKLFKKFEENQKLGIASGRTWTVDGDQMMYMKGDEPGGVKLCRRECFEDCGGIPLSYSWDSVLNTKAKLKGWESRRFDDIRQFSVRLICSAEGLWKGYKEHGKSSYYLGFNFIHVLAKGLKLSFEKPYYIGIAYLYGYFESWMLRKRQIDDKEIKNYYRYTRSKERIKNYFGKIKVFV